MSEQNDLETQLRSWAPRRPSAKLEQQIVARAQAAPKESEPAAPGEHPSFHLHWLAPATVALLFICVLVNPRSNFRPEVVRSEIIAMALSNQSAAPWLPGSFDCSQNSLPAETFEWTNGSRSASSIAPLSPAKGRIDEH